jgi:UDP-3-O-[3-hydroxymyristoyl] N-acetylglucosamine deacetylase
MDLDAYLQRTVKRSVECTGIGLHTGKKVNLRIKPAPPDHGILFHRIDLPYDVEIKAHIDNVVDTNLATTLGKDGAVIFTVEHLLATFSGLGIDNAIVEIDAPEVPIMDGSAASFVYLLKTAGIEKQKKFKKFIIIMRPFRIVDEDRVVSFLPSNELKITYTIDFDHPLMSDQVYVFKFSDTAFEKEISRARTFGFLRDVQTLQKSGFARGGSLDNAVVIDEFRVLNEEGLRFPDEFVRHKILDSIGDLSLLGYPMIGHFIAYKSGHTLNHRLLKKVIENPKGWKLLELSSQKDIKSLPFRVPTFGIPDEIPITA